jgi:GNAT superfamily N-acetyltransferase
MADLKVTIKPTESADVEGFKVEAEHGSLNGEMGYGPALARGFGNKTNPERYNLLMELEGPSAWLYKLKVEKAFRGKGLGAEILRATLDFLAESGIKNVVMSPQPEDFDYKERLENFYKRLGFRWADRKGLWNPLMILELD